jgi:hypothetical protein
MSAANTFSLLTLSDDRTVSTPLAQLGHYCFAGVAEVAGAAAAEAEELPPSWQLVRLVVFCPVIALMMQVGST